MTGNDHKSDFPIPNSLDRESLILSPLAPVAALIDSDFRIPNSSDSDSPILSQFTQFTALAYQDDVNEENDGDLDSGEDSSNSNDDFIVPDDNSLILTIPGPFTTGYFSQNPSISVWMNTIEDEEGLDGGL